MNWQKKQMNAFGGMLSFELKGGIEAGISFMNKINFCTLAPTLGDVDTLILHPASMSHLNIPKEVRERNGITDGLIRLSVGVEKCRGYNCRFGASDNLSKRLIEKLFQNFCFSIFVFPIR